MTHENRSPNTNDINVLGLSRAGNPIPLHRLREAGAGGSNPLAPTTKTPLQNNAVESCRGACRDPEQNETRVHPRVQRRTFLVPVSAPSDIVAILDARLETLSWTQTDLAHEAGYDRSRLNKILRGRQRLANMALCFDLCEALGLQICVGPMPGAAASGEDG